MIHVIDIDDQLQWGLNIARQGGWALLLTMRLPWKRVFVLDYNRYTRKMWCRAFVLFINLPDEGFRFERGIKPAY